MNLDELEWLYRKAHDSGDNVVAWGVKSYEHFPEILSRLRAAEKLRKSLDGQAYDDETEKAIAEYDRSKT